MTLAAGSRIGAYEIVSLLGAGGMGEVYRARDTRLKRDVAIKLLPDAFASDPERLARFQREAEVLASLNHPHIAGIHGLEESNGTRALVLELVEGETLADRIARGAIPMEEALPMARQIADALEAAHEQGIIHRDLKPANIKMTPDGVIKVLDFGLAKALEPMSAANMTATASPTITSPAMTGMGVILGTAAYMSPEQARGRAADKRSDIWAFGAVLYEMLTGKRPFEGEDVAETLAFVMAREPDWNALPPNLPSPVRTLLRRSLERDRRKRLGDMAGALVLIDESATPAAAAVTAAWREPVKSTRRSLTLVSAVASIGIGVVAVAATWLLTRPEPPRVVRSEIPTSGAAALSIQGIDRDLAITPDGSRLIYRGNNQLLVRALDQLEPDVLSGLDAPRGVFVAPDGQWLGFFDGNTTLKKVVITGGPPVTLARVDGSGPRGATWGTDGTIIISTSELETGLQRVSAAGGEPTVLTKPNREQGEAITSGRNFCLGVGQSSLRSRRSRGDSTTRRSRCSILRAARTRSSCVAAPTRTTYQPGISSTALPERSVPSRSISGVSR